MSKLADWYWSVGGDATHVWSSARAMSVPVADQAYADWQAVGGHYTTPIASMTELYAVLAAQFPAGSLPTYNADARFRRRNSGIIITSLSPATFMSDEASVNDINSSYNYGQANPAATFQWKMADGSFTALDATKITKLHNDALNYVQSCFVCESTNLAAITGGTITTLAQIDAAFAAISNTFP
jgi:hypothetical protein